MAITNSAEGNKVAGLVIPEFDRTDWSKMVSNALLPLSARFLKCCSRPLFERTALVRNARSLAQHMKLINDWRIRGLMKYEYIYQHAVLPVVMEDNKLHSNYWMEWRFKQYATIHNVYAGTKHFWKGVFFSMKSEEVMTFGDVGDAHHKFELELSNPTRIFSNWRKMKKVSVFLDLQVYW